MSQHVIHASEADFDTIVPSSDLPVLVDFWAPWCAPCRAIGPIVDRIAGDYADRVRVVKVDVQQNPALGARFNVRSIPMLLVFKGGQVHGTQVGAPPDIQARLVDLLDKAIAAA